MYKDFYASLKPLEGEIPYAEEERLAASGAPLLSWYRKNRRLLPWRENPEPYSVWISEIMLQQTRVEAVKPYFARFMEALPDIPSLAQVDRKVKELEKTLDAEPLKSKGNTFKGKGNTAVFENVTFAYEDKNVIQSADLVVEEGKKTALVGESGSGKSTLAKLLVHYYDIGGGKITLGGQDITDMSLDALNARISFVSQDNFLFNTSIYDNIKVGKPDATKEEVLVAAQKAQCMEFIDRLENGIDTLAGDCGSALSGGERQRVSLARAILKNAPVVILDEATAFADPENEEKMEKAIAEVVRGKTLLVIAHRLASIQNADKIYVLDNGRVAGSGTHKELLESNDIYKRLWQISEDSAAWNVVGTEGGAV